MLALAACRTGAHPLAADERQPQASAASAGTARQRHRRFLGHTVERDDTEGAAPRYQLELPAFAQWHHFFATRIAMAKLATHSRDVQYCLPAADNTCRHRVAIVGSSQERHDNLGDVRKVKGWFPPMWEGGLEIGGATRSRFACRPAALQRTLAGPSRQRHRQHTVRGSPGAPRPVHSRPRSGSASQMNVKLLARASRGAAQKNVRGYCNCCSPAVYYSALPSMALQYNGTRRQSFPSPAARRHD